MDLSAEFLGLDKLLSDIRSMGDGAEKELTQALDETALAGLALIQRDTPAGPNARGAWGVTKPDKQTRVIGTESKVNWFLEFGTGLYTVAPDGKHAKYKIEAKNGKALAFHWNGYQGGQRFQVASEAFGKQRAIFRSAKGNLTVNPKLAGNMAVLKYVMHPGIKPVGMVRGNLPRIRELFQSNVEAASDRMVEKFLRGF